MSRRCCIIGASGLIGTALTKRLISVGNFELCLIDKVLRETGQGEHVRSECCDLLVDSDLATAVDLVRGADCVFFKVGIPGNPSFAADPAYAQRFLDTNFFALVRLMEGCSENPPRRVLVDSSIAAVASKNSAGPITEREKAMRPMNFYGLSKLALEEFAGFLHRETGCDVIVFRYSRVHASGVRNVIFHFVRLLLKNEPLVLYGDLEKQLDFVHIDDVIDANVRALDLSSGFEVLHVTAGEPVTLMELAKRVIRICGKFDHPIVCDRDADVPIEPVLNSLDAAYSRRRLDMGDSVTLDAMIEETFYELCDSYE